MTIRRGILLSLLVLPLSGGCVYFNSLYNAQRLFDEAERARMSGHEAEARAHYDEVIAKAARSYRKEPDGGWADDALYLLGRAYLRKGDIGRAREALERARDAADDEEVRLGSTLYLGVVTAFMGDPVQGMSLLNQAIQGIRSDRLRGEGHLWRARLLMDAGRAGEGWWDLDQAATADRRLAVAADVERVLWGVIHGDPLRAARGADRLLGHADAHLRGDTLRALVGAAAEAWGPTAAAELLRSAHEAPWPPGERQRTLLLRASLRAQGADTAAAAADASRVAGGVGSEAVTARLMLAGFRLSGITRVAELEDVRPILLPAVGDPRVLTLLENMRKVELLVRDADQPGREVALFAAAEMARDALDAPALARGVFLSYADRARDPWRGKALLAALSLARDARDRDMLRGRLLALAEDPYVIAARSGGTPDEEFTRLEQELQAALSRVRADADAAAAELDVLVRERSDTLP